MSNHSATRNNENPGLCAACGGICCRTRPGIESPERFLSAEEPAQLLSLLLDSGEWVLERHLGLPETPETIKLTDRMGTVTWYPRPATHHEYRQHLLLGQPQPDDCIYLTVTGCSLPFADRPLLCKTLEPAADECHSSWKRPDAALAWWPLQQIVYQAVRLCHSQKGDLELFLSQPSPRNK